VRIAVVTDTSDPEVIQQMLQFTFEVNLHYLLRHPECPDLYRAGVRYQPEPREIVAEERFETIPEVLRKRWADCDDLACWLAAERVVRRKDFAATPLLVDATHPKYRDVAGGRKTWHVVVARGDGLVEDPSVALGMLRP
jgi:hypothetical protein